MALPKKNRLTTKKDINRVFKKGRTVRGSFLFINFLNNQKDYPRFTFVVPMKYVSLAVNRNKIKRTLSGEIARMLLSGCGYDIVVAIRRKIDKRQITSLREELRNMMLKNF